MPAAIQASLGFTASGKPNKATRARYNADGTPDATFGSGGKVTTDFFGSYDAAQAVSVQPDGKIIAAGYTHHEGTRIVFAVARYDRVVAPVIKKVKYKAGGKLVITGDDFNLSAKAFLDGHEVAPKSTEETVIVLKRQFLQPGRHELQVVNSDGGKAVYAITV